MKYEGGCHCGAVKFHAFADEEPKVIECNCSICNKTAYLHLIVEKADFHLLCGEEDLTTYTFNTGAAKHTFCKHCGIKSFYTPRSHPNGYSVNVRCLSNPPSSFSLQAFDGLHWEANIQKITD